MNDIYSEFSWHSAVGIDSALEKPKKFHTRLANTASYRSMFLAAGKDLLIHKTTKALWKMNGDHIEPVFGTDILSEDDVKLAMEP